MAGFAVRRYWSEEAVRVSVIGASGRIGGRIVQEAMARGHHAIAVVRDASLFDDSKLPNRGRDDGSLVVSQADVFDAETVAAAISGADVAVSAIGHAAQLQDAGYYVRAARSLVQALRSLGPSAPRLLIVGGFGSLETASGVLFADAGGYPDHAAAEIVGQRDALAFYRTVDDVQWTYIAPLPGGIRPGERTGSYRASRNRVDGEPRESRISIEDFAVAVIDEAERAQHVFGCITVTN